jgi:hypothetical protein
MLGFGDEIGLLWHEKGASESAFAQGYMNATVHNPAVQCVDEDEKELERELKRRESLRAQLKASDERVEQIVTRIAAKPEAAAKFERGEDMAPCLLPKCEAAIAKELRSDAQHVLAAADLQVIPALRALLAKAGLKVESATGHGEGVRIRVLLPREQIDNLPPQPTREGFRRRLAESFAAFLEHCPDRGRVVAELKAAVARVLARFGLAGSPKRDRQQPSRPPSPREIAAAHFVFSPLKPAAP